MTTALRQKLLAAATAAVGLSIAGCAADRVVVYRYPPPASAVYQPAQVTYATPTQPGYSATATNPSLLTAPEIDQLTAPIALDPDPLLAVILPASTYPNDIAAADNWLRSNPQPTDDQINGQPWDPAVKVIVHYPKLFTQLAGNMEWTQALGAAFVNQQQDVMDSIQRLRAQAQAAGNLYTTPQQNVVVEQGMVEIVPVSTDYLYVPVYDPYLVYVRPCPYWFDNCGSFGLFLDFGFDWGHHRIDRFRDGNRNFGSGRFDRTASGASTPWVRDSSRAAPVMPQRFVRPGDHRAFSTFSQSRNFQAATPNWQGRQGSVRSTPTLTFQPHSNVQPQYHWQPQPRVQQVSPTFHTAPEPRYQPAPQQRFAPAQSSRSAPAPAPQASPRSDGGGGGGGHQGGDGGGRGHR